jgi:hypothetical protein
VCLSAVRLLCVCSSHTQFFALLGCCRNLLCPIDCSLGVGGAELLLPPHN